MIKQTNYPFLKPVYFIYKLWIGLIFWLTLLLLYPAFRILLSNSKWYPKAFKLKRLWSFGFQVLLFCPVKVQYKGTIPKSPYIVVSNHCSYLDTVFMYSVIKDYFLFVGKGELLRWPLFSRFFKTMDIPVHRHNSKKAYLALQKAYDAIERGECIALYPEGTIPDYTPKMKSFKNGAFKMAIDKKVPILPVTWLNNHRVMLDPSKIFEYSLPQAIHVVVHETIYTHGYTDADLILLRNKTFNTIASVIPAMHSEEKK